MCIPGKETNSFLFASQFKEDSAKENLQRHDLFRKYIIKSK